MGVSTLSTAVHSMPTLYQGWSAVAIKLSRLSVAPASPGENVLLVFREEIRGIYTLVVFRPRPELQSKSIRFPISFTSLWH